jgi:hypothetical protein
MTVVGASETSAYFGALGARASTAVPALVAHFGSLYQNRVKSRASGRPGPNVITGDYRATIGMEFAMIGGVATATVSTSAPQAPRLENGYFGTDSLGRTYHQGPFPHWEPDLIRTADEMGAAASALVGEGVEIGVDSNSISSLSFT